jgi:hypothetical protein
MSRGVEDYTLTTVLDYAREQDFDRVIVRFTKGPKNDQMQTILNNNHFVESELEEESVVYSFDLKRQSPNPRPDWFSPIDSDVEKMSVSLL